MVSIITVPPFNSWFTASHRVETPSPQASFSIQEVKNATPPVINTNVWEELSQTYDVRNATFGEMKEITNKFHHTDAISGKDVAILTFEMRRCLFLLILAYMKWLQMNRVGEIGLLSLLHVHKKTFNLEIE